MLWSSENNELADDERSAQPYLNVSGVAAATALWLMAVFGGAAVLLDYSFSGDLTVAAPARYQPSADSVSGAGKANDGRIQVFAFLHPRCPCSRATLIQLAEVARQNHSIATLQVVFFCPADQQDSWAQHELWDLAAHRAGLSCRVDRGGLLTREFGVQTSGHILVFDQSGRRVFSGGITSSRGHEGESLGSQLLSKICCGLEIAPVELPVFGCAIIADDLNSGGRES